jgi:hypothetical protein
VEVLGIGVSGRSFESVWPSSFDIPLSPYPVPGYKVSIHPGLIFLNEGEVIEAIIERGDLRVRIIDMGLGA